MSNTFLNKEHIDIFYSHLENRVDKFSERLFQGRMRIYYDIDLEEKISNNEVYLMIKELLEDYNEGEIVDYIKGIYKDNYGRMVKIGKFLTKHNEKKVLDLYINDKQRTLKVSADGNTITKYKICISRQVEDILYMTTDRVWEKDSCMKIGNMDDKMLGEMKNQTLVAYLIDYDDLDIKKPYSRILIKKHHLLNDDETWIYYPSPIIYGNDSKVFKDFIFDWVKKNQIIKNGIYILNSESEGFGYPLIPFYDNLKEEDIRDMLISYKDEVFEIVDGNFEITENLEVNIIAKNSPSKKSSSASGSVIIKECFKELPFKFGKVDGDFIMSDNIFTTLKNCPDYVGGDFDCSDNKLTSLEGCPKEVGGKLSCHSNYNLSSLQFIPKMVSDLEAWSCAIKTLEDCPLERVNNIDLDSNNLKDLKGFPIVMNGISVANNNLTSLEGVPNKRFYNFNVSGNSGLIGKYTEVSIREMYRIRGNLWVDEEIKKWEGDKV